MTHLPLAGRRVVVTRAPHQAADFAALLRARGAVPLLYPAVEIVPPEDTGPLDGALRRAAAGEFDWLVVTSRNTVMALAGRIEALGLRDSLNQLHVAAVGPGTAEAVTEVLGAAVSLLPDEYVAESLVEAMQQVAGGQRVLLPQSAIARPILRSGLAAAGLEVEAVDAYRTVPGSGGDDIPTLLAARRIDAVTFTSSSTVVNFLARLDAAGADRHLLDGVCIACIGPIAGQTAGAHGLGPVVIPAEYTLDGLVAALEAHFSALTLDATKEH